jgi:hypothetical protein
MGFLYASIEQILHSKLLLLRSVNYDSSIHTIKIKKRKNEKYCFVYLFIWVIKGNILNDKEKKLMILVNK